MKTGTKQDLKRRAQQIIEVWLNGDEYRRRRLLEFLGVPVVLCDIAGNILDINVRAHVLLGYKKRQDIINENFLSILVEKQDLDEGFFGAGMNEIIDRAIYLKNKEEENISFFIDLYEHKGIYLVFLIEAEGYQDVKEALLVIKQRYKSILENALEGICIIGKKGFLAVNERFASIFGYSLQEIYDLHPLDFIKEENRKSMEYYLHTIMDNEILVRERLVYGFVNKFKMPVDCEVSYFSTIYEGQFALQVHVRKIQDMECYRQKMRYIEEKYRRLLYLAYEPIIMVADHRVIFANKSFCRLTGYTEEELQSSASWKWLAPEYRGRVAALIKRCQQEEQELFKLKADIFTCRGERLRSILHLSFISYNDKPAVIISLPAVDLRSNEFNYSDIIKDRIEKRILKVIAESKGIREAFFAILQCLAEEMPDYSFAFYIYRDNLVHIYARRNNKNFFSVLHRSELEIDEEYGYGLFREYSLKNSTCFDDRELLAEGYDYAAKVHLYGLNKNIGIFKWAYRKEEERSSNHIIARIMSDVSLALARMLAWNKDDGEKAGREKEKLDLLQRFTLIGDIAVNIAHEMRNPMTTIKGLAQMLTLENPQNTDYYNMIIEEIDRVDDIIRNFLRLSRDIITELKETEISYLVDRVLVSLWDEFLTRHVNLIRSYDFSGLKVRVDQNQMEQALRNILCNALEASAPGDTVRIEIGKKDNFACIVFADEGEGIDEVYLERVMEPFFTTKDNSTGLGLSISYKIIKEHGGEIKLESKLCKGTRVEVYLPLVDV
ncbi:PAS domain S-box-containing protein [Thermosyntropha lipolytica DSM 11003]|uniref:histidine kinase n=1 Tax=Thermosyntropha lipolytica DSM 11003 TaxID=1123382 RepID=A0A1M5N2G8_9FIRM|nr:PAS domain S-box protein [Thermosyntropha lipolytica]SHG83764.1 PAS domain S-box-containing protein [Thermosyntropha lipolytica DSM 11003]